MGPRERCRAATIGARWRELGKTCLKLPARALHSPRPARKLDRDANRRVARSSNGRAMSQMKRSVVVRVGPHRLTTTDLVVVLGMVLVAVALGVGLHLQIGISAGVAAVVALTAG